MTETEQLADVIALSVHLAIEPLIAKNIALEAKVAALEARPIVQGRDGKDADLSVVADFRSELTALRAELIAIKAWPAPKDGQPGASVTVADVAPLIATEVHKAVAAIPVPTNGTDGKSVSVDDVAPLIASEVQKAVAAMPAPKDGADGKSLSIEDLAPTIVTEVAKAVAAIPLPVNGSDGINGKNGADGLPGKDGRDGADGKDGVPGRDGADGLSGKDGANGRDGIDGKDGAAGKDGADGLHGKDGAPGQDGKSLTVDDVAPLIAAEVQQRVRELPLANDGLGVTGALINRDGHLVLTFSDGTTNDVGIVIGKDGAAGLNGQDGAPGLAGKDGDAGLGFDDLDVAFHADAGYMLRFVRGEHVKEFPIPVPFDAGVWQSGRTYPKGAGVTVKGAFFIAQQRTAARPDDGSVESRAWRLSVKAGRDGREGKPGRDLTERSDG